MNKRDCSLELVQALNNKIGEGTAKEIVKRLNALRKTDPQGFKTTFIRNQDLLARYGGIDAQRKAAAAMSALVTLDKQRSNEFKTQALQLAVGREILIDAGGQAMMRHIDDKLTTLPVEAYYQRLGVLTDAADEFGNAKIKERLESALRNPETLGKHILGINTDSVLNSQALDNFDQVLLATNETSKATMARALDMEDSKVAMAFNDMESVAAFYEDINVAFKTGRLREGSGADLLGVNLRQLQSAMVEHGSIASDGIMPLITKNMLDRTRLTEMGEDNFVANLLKDHEEGLIDLNDPKVTPLEGPKKVAERELEEVAKRQAKLSKKIQVVNDRVVNAKGRTEELQGRMQAMADSLQQSDAVNSKALAARMDYKAARRAMSDNIRERRALENRMERLVRREQDLEKRAAYYRSTMNQEPDTDSTAKLQRQQRRLIKERSGIAQKLEALNKKRAKVYEKQAKAAALLGEGTSEVDNYDGYYNAFTNMEYGSDTFKRQVSKAEEAVNEAFEELSGFSQASSVDPDGQLRLLGSAEEDAISATAESIKTADARLSEIDVEEFTATTELVTVFEQQVVREREGKTPPVVNSLAELKAFFDKTGNIETDLKKDAKGIKQLQSRLAKLSEERATLQKRRDNMLAGLGNAVSKTTGDDLPEFNKAAKRYLKAVKQAESAKARRKKAFDQSLEGIFELARIKSETDDVLQRASDLMQNEPSFARFIETQSELDTIKREQVLADRRYTALSDENRLKRLKAAVDKTYAKAKTVEYKADVKNANVLARIRKLEQDMATQERLRGEAETELETLSEQHYEAFVDRSKLSSIVNSGSDTDLEAAARLVYARATGSKAREGLVVSEEGDLPQAFQSTLNLAARYHGINGLPLKDMQAYIRMNEKYGRGKHPLDDLVQGTNRMSHDLAIAKTFGPLPEYGINAMYNAIEKVVGTDKMTQYKNKTWQAELGGFFHGGVAAKQYINTNILYNMRDFSQPLQDFGASLRTGTRLAVLTGSALMQTFDFIPTAVAAMSRGQVDQFMGRIAYAVTDLVKVAARTATLSGLSKKAINELIDNGGAESAMFAINESLNAGVHNRGAGLLDKVFAIMYRLTGSSHFNLFNAEANLKTMQKVVGAMLNDVGRASDFGAKWFENRKTWQRYGINAEETRYLSSFVRDGRLQIDAIPEAGLRERARTMVMDQMNVFSMQALGGGLHSAIGALGTTTGTPSGEVVRTLTMLLTYPSILAQNVMPRLFADAATRGDKAYTFGVALATLVTTGAMVQGLKEYLNYGELRTNGKNFERWADGRWDETNYQELASSMFQWGTLGFGGRAIDVFRSQLQGTGQPPELTQMMGPVMGIGSDAVQLSTSGFQDLFTEDPGPSTQTVNRAVTLGTRLAPAAAGLGVLRMTGSPFAAGAVVAGTSSALRSGPLARSLGFEEGFAAAMREYSNELAGNDYTPQQRDRGFDPLTP